MHNIKHTEETKRKISNTLSRVTIGHKPTNLKSNSGSFKKGHKLNIGRILPLRSPEHTKKILTHREKSSLEVKFENIINKLGLPYKFVGNGEVLIARKSPDFINTNGEKIAIEVYYKKHKDKFHKLGLEGWKVDRIKVFSENGWKVIFFDETQVNEDNIKLLNLVGGK